nr:MAG: nonstructural protein [Microvirus sp.]
MNMIICSIFDVKSGLYSRPFPQQNAAVAVRGFKDEVNRQDPSNDMFKHPEDFKLYVHGYFDDTTGVISGSGMVELLITGTECVNGSV